MRHPLFFLLAASLFLVLATTGGDAEAKSACKAGEGVEKLILIQSDSRVGRGSTALILEVVNR